MRQDQPTDARPSLWRSIRTDLLVALALALILSIGWSLTDWQRLSRLLLPDTDDMMRLAQVRDWLAGQGLNDWTQYRMAPPQGAPMHWSRINDFGLATIILALTPVVGRHAAELVAVLAYPGLIFFVSLFGSARIARRLWGPAAGPVAAVLMALAYPGTTVFIPGRIDHHALQVVLIQLFVLLLMRKPSLAAGAAAGVVAGVTLVVGLETAPQVAALLLTLSASWVVRGIDERMRLAGFAAGLGSATLCFLLFLRPHFWTAALCDAFTPASSTGTLAAAAALALLAAATPKLPSWHWRLGVGAVVGGIALGATLFAFPACVSGPYGVMDPFLLEALMPYIDEAVGVTAQPDLARAISKGGVLLAGCVASVWMLAHSRDRWRVVLPIAAVVLMSALVTLAQVRGAYIGAPLAAPVLAGVVLAARRLERWRTPAVLGAWLACAGLAYLEIPKLVAGMIPRPAGTGRTIGENPQVPCSAGDAWRQLNDLLPGVTMAGTSVAPYLIGATHHSTVGAGYHRNNAGNMAMYRFFLRPSEDSLEIARRWKVRYVAFCPGDFDEIRVATNFPHSLAAQLRAGKSPDWLEPIPLGNAPLRFYRIR